MREPYPPLWENYQNIRGGSYSLRGGPEEGADYFKTYILGSMLNQVTIDPNDIITGIAISPKIMIGHGGAQKVGFYVIKVWNKDAEKFNKTEGIHLLHSKLVPADIMYTPHVDKKM
jgi:hypothetical protein